MDKIKTHTINGNLTVKKILNIIGQYPEDYIIDIITVHNQYVIGVYSPKTKDFYHDRKYYGS